MIDIHTHLLPGLDDGSPDLENSLSILETIGNTGVSDLFVTPHYIPGEFNNTPDIIRSGLQVMREEAQKRNLPVNLHFGAEVYLTADINGDDNLGDFCLGNSKYILVETAMNGFPVNILEILYKLVKKGYKPILAHPERYADIAKNIELAEDLVYRNVYMQANAGSFVGLYGSVATKTVWQLFHKGLIHFIASDCHCQSNDYTLADVNQMLTEQFPDYPIELFTKINPGKILSNQNIEYFNTPVQAVTNNKGAFLNKIFRFFYDG